jgi:hypothetical protein
MWNLNASFTLKSQDWTFEAWTNVGGLITVILTEVFRTTIKSLNRKSLKFCVFVITLSFFSRHYICSFYRFQIHPMLMLTGPEQIICKMKRKRTKCFITQRRQRLKAISTMGICSPSRTEKSVCFERLQTCKHFQSQLSSNCPYYPLPPSVITGLQHMCITFSVFV